MDSVLRPEPTLRMCLIELVFLLGYKGDANFFLVWEVEERTVKIKV